MSILRHSRSDSLSSLNADLKGNVLWENTNNTNEFPAQTITLSDSVSNYDYYEVEYGDYGAGASESILYYSSKVKSNGNNGVRLSSIGSYTYYRKGYPNGNTFVFDDAYYGSTKKNINCIPFKIIGYKIK